MHGYYASIAFNSIAFNDAQIGSAVNALDEESLAENPIAVLWTYLGR